MDFTVAGCAFKRVSYLRNSILTSLLPIGLIVLSSMCFFIRLQRPWSSSNRKLSKRASTRIEQGRLEESSKERLHRLKKEHALLALFITYIFLPTVSQHQFAALECVEVAGIRYLYQDTSIRCDSHVYKNFIIATIVFIVAYQSVPLMWFVLLWRKRHFINPDSSNKRDKINEDESGVRVPTTTSRYDDESLQHLAFLWQVRTKII
jgi:hypothetical protein